MDLYASGTMDATQQGSAFKLCIFGLALCLSAVLAGIHYYRKWLQGQLDAARNNGIIEGCEAGKKDGYAKGFEDGQAAEVVEQLELVANGKR